MEVEQGELMAPLCPHVCSLVRSGHTQQGACIWDEFNIWALALPSNDAVVLFRVFLFPLYVKLCCFTYNTVA